MIPDYCCHIYFLEYLFDENFGRGEPSLSRMMDIGENDVVQVLSAFGEKSALRGQGDQRYARS